MAASKTGSLLRLEQAQKETVKGPKVLDERQEAFLEWILLPEVMRVPRTMEAYHEEHGISYATLKRWKALPQFRAAHERKVREGIATPERVESMAKAAYERGFGDGSLDSGDIKWATLWAQMAGLTKTEPGLQKTGAESLADLTDDELAALARDSAIAEINRRADG